MLRASPDGMRQIETEARMNEDRFNMEIRKFLKKVGVTSQREIERAVQEAIASGRLKGKETLKARITLSIDGLDLAHEIDGDISLA
jgi:ribosomal protein L1